MNPTTKVRRTSSLWAACVALCQGVRLLGVQRVVGQKAVWLLSDEDNKASAALQEWHQGEPLVSARAIIAARSILLDAILNSDQPQANNKE
jgi:hypothetical protein